MPLLSTLRRCKSEELTDLVNVKSITSSTSATRASGVVTANQTAVETEFENC
jgi:hypothetical protein